MQEFPYISTPLSQDYTSNQLISQPLIQPTNTIPFYRKWRDFGSNKLFLTEEKISRLGCPPGNKRPPVELATLQESFRSLSQVENCNMDLHQIEYGYLEEFIHTNIVNIKAMFIAIILIITSLHIDWSVGYFPCQTH